MGSKFMSLSALALSAVVLLSTDSHAQSGAQIGYREELIRIEERGPFGARNFFWQEDRQVVTRRGPTLTDVDTFAVRLTSFEVEEQFYQVVRFKRICRRYNYSNHHCLSGWMHQDETFNRPAPPSPTGRSISKTASVRVSGSPLLAGESENHRFTLIANSNGLYVSSDYYSYGISEQDNGNDVVYHLQGSRKRVVPPNTLGVTLSFVNGQLRITARDTGLQPGFEQGIGQAEMVFSILEREAGKKDNKKRGETKETNTLEMPFDGSATTLDTGFVASQPGAKVYVVYRMRRLNSSFYDSSSLSGKVETSRIPSP